MKKFLEFVRHNHAILYKAFLFATALALIVALFPTGGKFKYEFDKNKPWQHENLISPFDYAIKKSKKELQTEEENVKREAEAFYIYNDKVFDELSTAINLFIQTDSLFSTLDSVKRADLSINVHELLKDIYNKGVVSIINTENNNDYILVAKGNTVETVEFGSLYTIPSAASYIDLWANDLKETPYKKGLVKLLKSKLAFNIMYDEAKTKKNLQQELDNISSNKGMVRQGEGIVSKGDIVDDFKYQKLVSLRAKYEEQQWSESNYNWILFGQIVLVGLNLLILFLFIQQYRPLVLEGNSQTLFILVNIVLIVVMASLVQKLNPEYLYIAPFAILPLVLRGFFDTRLALFVHLITITIVSFLVPNPFEFFFLQLMAGIVSIITVVDLYKRSHLFISVAKIVLTYFVAYFGIAILQQGSFSELELQNFLFFAGSGVLTLFAYPLIYAFEKSFGLVSDVSLLELSDTNNKLLRELGERAPGTFQHSLQVANLAETAVAEIGGNALLVRTGALYHDIGKMETPLYFIENQTTGLNPHDELSFEESAQIIINHVKRGIDIAKKNNLPDRVIDFIRTHHGTSTVHYFYRQYMKNFPDEIVDKERFSYLGPKPFSKETAVLMMADSVEAASRSLKEPNAEKISALVENIINSQIEEKQFINADITMRDITLIKKMFIKKLINIHHLRIEYPE